MTAVSTQSGMSTETSVRLWRETPRRCRWPCGVRGVWSRRLGAPEQVLARGGLLDVLQAGHRPAVEHPATALPRARPDVDDPVRASYDVHVVLDHEERVARRLEPGQHVEQRLGIGRVQAGRGLVQHVDDPEQAGPQLGRDPQALGLAGRQGRRGAPEAEVAQAEVEQHLDARDQVGADPHRHLVGLLGQLARRAAGQRPASANDIALTSAMECPATVTASASGRSPLPWHSGQGTLRTNRSARSRIRSLLESASTCMTCLRALQNFP